MAEVVIERKQVRISLDGFFVSTSSPTEEALKITVDCTDLPWDRFGQLIRDLQDELTALDRDFAARSERIRGRKIIGGHRKDIATNMRIKTIRFSPFPSRFSNLLKNLRKQRYALINAYGIEVSDPANPFERSVYLLPRANAEAFLADIEAINARLEELQREVDQFIGTPAFAKVIGILESAGLKVKLPTFRIGRVSVRLTPASISPEFIEKFAETSPKVAEAIREAERAAVRAAVEAIRRRLEAIAKAKLKDPSVARAKIRELDELAQRLGLEAIREACIVPLFKAIDRPAEYFAAKAKVSERLRSLIEQLS